MTTNEVTDCQHGAALTKLLVLTARDICLMTLTLSKLRQT